MIQVKAKADIHPCFNAGARLKYARVHLPVAPRCNVQCKYCNRKYDCVNESRPGVTSTILTPWQALAYTREISSRIDKISTIGIAGPGDAFADPSLTMETIRLIKSEFPEKIFCISTNGLNIEPYVAELSKLDVTHVTLTVNSLIPDTLAHIYSWVRYNQKVYRGVAAGNIVAQAQDRALDALVSHGIIVKINCVVIPGINDTETGTIAEWAAAKGASLMNCIPLIPARGSEMESVIPPTRESMNSIVKGISEYLKPMTHCARCRADAAGIIGKDDQSAYRLIGECAAFPVPRDNNRPNVAVASYEGVMINRHLGEATELLIFTRDKEGYNFLEKRKTPVKGKGDLRWVELASILPDCSYVLVNGVGARPVDVLEKTGIAVIEMAGLIEDGLDAVYKGKKLKSVIKTGFSKGDSCSGNGMGCG